MRRTTHLDADLTPANAPPLLFPFPSFQTFGGLVNINPHLHVLAADGAFLADGRLIALPPCR